MLWRQHYLAAVLDLFSRAIVGWAMAAITSHGIRVSMSCKGNCYDNAVMERFFGTLKGECVTRFVFETREASPARRL